MTVSGSPHLRRDVSPRDDPVPRWPWRSLSQIADAAVALQDEATAVLVEAVSDEPKGARLGRRGYAVIDGYFHLREAVLAGAESPMRDRLDRLLNYHQQVVQQSMLFAFGSPGPRAREEMLRHFSTDLGVPGAELRALAAELKDDDSGERESTR